MWNKNNFLLNDEEEEGLSKENYTKDRLVREAKYSPGEYQRLKLNKLLSKESSFLLISEPTSHLDIKQKDKLAESLKIGIRVIFLFCSAPLNPNMD